MPRVLSYTAFRRCLTIVGIAAFMALAVTTPKYLSSSVATLQAAACACPTAPVVTFSGRGNQTITVRYDLVDATPAVTQYLLRVSTDGFGTFQEFGVSAPTAQITATGLTNGTPYTWQLYAQNTDGLSPAASGGPLTPATVPGAPGIVSATSLQNGQSLVTWTAPGSNGGATIDEYVVTATGGPTPLVTGFAFPALSGTMTGLTNGTTYTFTVKARNVIGDSAASAGTTGKPATVPGAPTIGTGTRGNQQVTVTFTAPGTDGGDTITGYTVTSIPAGGVDSNAGSTSLSHVVTGLTNGTPYTFTVKATNGVGESVASAAGAGATPATVPNAPTGVVGTSGNREVSVAFTAPVVNGGSAVTGYTVTSNPGGFTKTGASSPLVVTGLTNGTSYTFTVKATNAVGTGADSVASAGVEAAGTPDAPTGVSGVSQNAAGLPPNGVVRVSFTPPANQGGGGFAVNKYVVTASPGGRTAFGPASPIDVTGLETGTAYTFTVTATNNYLGGTDPQSTSVASSASGSVIPLGAPAAPTSPVATRGNASASVAFTAPTNTGGGTISGYTVTSSPGSFTGTGTTSPVTVNGLTNGVSYTFTVTATNEYGTSPASTASAAVTPAAVPSAAVAPTAVAGDRQAVVSFVAPADNGAAITGYTVTSSPGGFTATGGASPLTVTGLTNTTAYTFTVTATNAVGTGSASPASNSVTPTGTPQPPTAVTATSNEDGQSTVRFTAPANDGGSAILRYRVTSNPGGVIVTREGTLTEVNVTGLTNGVSYTFTVEAGNANGFSSASAASAAAIPAALPGAPTGVAAVYGNTTAAISFTAPVFTGGLAITGYTVNAYVGGALSASQTTASSPYTFTGLTNGTAYTFKVAATTSAGTGAESTASAATTPRTVPGAPTGVTATSNANTQSVVTFVAPASTGGAAITGYTVTSNPAGGVDSNAGSTSLSHVITGLTNGTAYTFTVKATNSEGDSAASAASAAATPATVPGAPTGVTATFGNASASVTFVAPASTGGSAITTYTVTSSPGGFTSTGLATTQTVNGLQNGTAYTFTVTATNGAGTGAASAASASVTPKTVPDAPSGVTATRGNGSASVSFAAPGSNGGSAITTYTVTSNPGGFTSTGISTTQTVSGLTNGVAYTFTVTATNVVGIGAASTASSAVTPATVPGQPTTVTGVAGDTTATISFVAPSSNGASISDYTVKAYISGSLAFTRTTTSNPYVFTGLTNGTTYTFTVTANNEVGAGMESSATSGVKPATAPGQPTGVTAFALNSSARVSFTAPASDGGSAIIDYTVTVVGGASTVVTSSPAIISGLTNGVAYTFTVSARNAINSGAASSASNSVTPRVPNAGQDFNLDGKNDLVWRHATSGQNVIWHMNNAGLMSTFATINSVPDTTWRIEGLGDFDNDGKADIVWRNTVSGAVYIWKMNGTTFVSTNLVRTIADTNFEIAATGDFNGDGKTDLVWSNRSTGVTVVWYMDGMAFSSFVATDTVPAGYRIVGAGDFNADTKVDLVLRHSTTGQNVVWFMNGVTRSSNGSITTVADTNFQITTVSDLNGDTKPDVVFRNVSTGQTVTWFMNGTTMTSFVVTGTIPVIYMMAPGQR